MARGQSALEYLVTYGWVLLAVLVLIGALSYFGIINPGKWIADTCDLGNQMECVDYYLNSSDDSVNLYLRNKFGKDIFVTAAEVTDIGGSRQGNLRGGSVLLGASDVGEIIIENLNIGALIVDEKQQFTLNVTFRRATPPGSSHELAGLLYAETQ